MLNSPSYLLRMVPLFPEASLSSFRTQEYIFYIEKTFLFIWKIHNVQIINQIASFVIVSNYYRSGGGTPLAVESENPGSNKTLTASSTSFYLTFSTSGLQIYRES